MYFVFHSLTTMGYLAYSALTWSAANVSWRLYVMYYDSTNEGHEINSVTRTFI
jgi:hypothetical protein